MGLFISTSSFTRGEVGPRFWDRSDVDFYNSAAKLVDNFFVDLAGGAFSRPPLQFAASPITDVPDATFADEALFSFAYKEYDIELLVRVTATRTSIYLKGRVYKRTSTGPSRVSTADFAYTFSAASAIPSTYRLSQIFSLASVGPSAFLTSEYLATKRIIFTDGASPTVSVESVIWYEELLGIITVTSGSPTWTGEDSLFTEQLQAGDKVYVEGVQYTVSSVTDNETVVMTTNYSGLSVGGLRIYKEKSNPFGTGQWPRLCAFDKSRLFLFSTPARPTTMWASKVGNPFIILAGSTYDDSPIEYDLMAGGIDYFTWSYAAAGRILLGGSAGCYMIQADSDGGYTPTNFSFVKISDLGSSRVAPVFIGSQLYFVGRSGTQIFGVVYDYARSGFAETDISTFATHLIEEGVLEMQYRPPTTNDPTPRLFVLTLTGELRVIAISSDQNVIAWGRGSFGDGLMVNSLSIASDLLVCYVADAVSGKSFMCFLDYDPNVNYTMDLMLTYTPSDSVISAAVGHRGRSVGVISENKGFLGYFSADEINEIDLSTLGWDDEELGDVTVGIPYRARIKMLPCAMVTRTGAILNRKRRMIRILVSVLETRQLFVDDRALFGVVGNQLGKELPEHSGVFEMRVLGWYTQDEVILESAGVSPARILSVTREIIT